MLVLYKCPSCEMPYEDERGGFVDDPVMCIRHWVCPQCLSGANGTNEEVIIRINRRVRAMMGEEVSLEAFVEAYEDLINDGMIVIE